MLRKIYTLFVFAAFFISGFSPELNAQCSGGSNSGSITPTAAWQTIGCVTGGQYYTFSAVNGTSYTFTFCQGGGSASWDTQITILNNTGGYAGGYNDDNCGLQSEVVWTAPSTGTFRVLINQFSCTTNATCGTLAYRSNAPLGPGSTCGNPFVIPSLPFNQTGMTTCGYGDDYSSANACGSSYMNGDDFVYTYNSPGNERITITLSNTGTWTGVFVLNGCPSGGGTQCLPLSSGGLSCTGGAAATNTASGGNPFGTWDLTSAGTYYIVISTFPSPQCTGFDINITTAPSSGGGGPGNACYTVSTITHAPANYNQGTVVSFPDDQFSPSAIPIGFNFCYMGSWYSDFIISSNAYITFNLTCAGQYSPWDTEPLPAVTYLEETSNSILGPWHDIDPGVTGTIRYQLQGTTPNRRLVVKYQNIAMFSVSCNSQLFNGQIMLYETSNIIENHITNKPVCATWNNGEAVQGLTDWSGTAVVTVGGRNNTVWAVNNDARRFTPSCCNVLPVEYISIHGENFGEKNILEWETQYEKGTYEFVILKSSDGQMFSELGRMNNQGGENSGASYTIEDLNPIYPVTYYQIKELNMSGGSTVSEVIAVKVGEDAFGISNLYMDQQADLLTLNLKGVSENSDIGLEVMNSAGQVLIRKNISLNQGTYSAQLDVNKLSAGYYLVKVNNGQASDVKRFIKY